MSSGTTPTDRSPEEKRQRRARSRNLAKLLRWLHIYISLISFAIIFFFSVTGITLNHPTWLGAAEESIRETKGTFPEEWIAVAGVPLTETNSVMRLEIVEKLRREEGARGFLETFLIDDYQLTVGFRGPAYSLDVFVDRETGDYDLVESKSGMVAIMNDLHKGRDTGEGWRLLIDISAIVLILVSFTGFSLLFWLKRHLLPGIMVAVLGLALSIAGYVYLVTQLK